MPEDGAWWHGGSYAGLLRDRWHLLQSYIEHTGVLLAEPMHHAFPPQKNPYMSVFGNCLLPSGVTPACSTLIAQGSSEKPERYAIFWRPWPGEVAVACFMEFWLSRTRQFWNFSSHTMHNFCPKVALSAGNWPMKKARLYSSASQKTSFQWQCGQRKCLGPFTESRFSSFTAQISKRVLLNTYVQQVGQAKTCAHPCTVICKRSIGSKMTIY